MKRLFLAVGVILIVLFAGVMTAGARDFHHHGFRGGVILGPVWSPWWGPYDYGYGYPYAYPYSYGYREPAIVIDRDPPVYFQRDDGPGEQYYWYYCRNPKGYYPYVKSCPDGWKKVLPTPPPSDGKE
ncbi:MAG: hypothetical protein WA610_11900 [Thermodesulfovibrionales bacterium]